MDIVRAETITFFSAEFIGAVLLCAGAVLLILRGKPVAAACLTFPVQDSIFRLAGVSPASAVLTIAVLMQGLKKRSSEKRMARSNNTLTMFQVFILFGFIISLIGGLYVFDRQSMIQTAEKYLSDAQVGMRLVNFIFIILFCHIVLNAPAQKRSDWVDWFIKGSVVSAFVSISQYLFFLVGRDSGAIFIDSTGFWRAKGLAHEPGHIATVYALALLLALIRKQKWNSFMLAIGLTTTFSVTGCIVVSSYFLFKAISWTKFTLRLRLAAILVGIAFFFGSTIAFKIGLGMENDPYPYYEQRGREFHSTYELFQLSPFTGIGFFSTNMLAGENIPGIDYRSSFCNAFLAYWCETGLVGTSLAALSLLPLFSYYWTEYKRRKRQGHVRDKDLILFAASAWVMLMGINGVLYIYFWFALAAVHRPGLMPAKETAKRRGRECKKIYP